MSTINDSDAYIYVYILKNKRELFQSKLLKTVPYVYIKCEFNDATYTYVCANQCVYMCQQMPIEKSKHTTYITCSACDFDI